MKVFLRRAATYPAAALLAGLAVVALAVWWLALPVVLLVAVLALLLGFLIVLLRRADAGSLARQSSLQESEARMRAITDSAQDAILMMNPEGKVSYWNPAAGRIFGYTAAEATGQDLHALIAHSRYHEAHRAALPAFLATGEGAAVGRTLDLTAIRKDGQEIEVQLSLSALQLEGRWHSVGIVRDITESKRNEEKLLELSVAVEQNPASIVITNLAGEIEYVNPKFCEVTGYTREEALGRNPRILKSGELPRERYRELWETILAGKTWRGEFHNKTKSGELYWELASISPIRDTAGQVTRFVAVKEDITRRKQAEEELLESNLQLKETTARANELAAEATLANAAKSEFLANMSHEIRTPMNGVIGMTGMLLNSGLTDTQRRYAEIVHRSGESLLLLIADVLDHSKIEAGKLELEAADFDLDGVLDDISGVMALGARKKGLGFHCSADADVPTGLRGDPGRLRQVLLNLVGNAIKFTAHGEVAVRASLVPATGSAIVVSFAVRDTGIGIPADKQERIFEKFTQADASTTRQYGGTGLGLAISKELTYLMGGEIGVTSTVGEGSEFWFTACFAPPEGPLAPRQQPALHDVEALAPARILLAEDNITNQQMTVIFLERLGLTVDAVTNGAEAVRAVQTTPCDLVLMDVLMPGMDGLEATKAIRKAESEKRKAESEKRKAKSEKRKAESQNSESKIQNPKSETAPPSSFSSRLPIIALTGLALKGDREKCLAAGMDDYLTKPIKFEALAAALKRWLPQGQSSTGFPACEPAQTQAGKPVSHSGEEAAGLTRERAPLSPEGAAFHSPGQASAAPRVTDQIPPSPEGATSLPPAVYDRAALMVRLQDNEKLARRVIEGFLGDLPAQLAQLKAHAAAGDAHLVQQQAHKIKGACATVGGDALCALAAALEQAGQDGDLAGIADRMRKIDAGFAALKAAMQEAD